jgi:phage terminase large subunit
VYWVNHWAWTYDPRRSPAAMPFDLWPRQAEFIRWLEERERARESGLAEKSRDVGFTWLCAAYALHRWLFVPGSKITFGSRKEALVDQKGNPDCIFEKIRMIQQRLPAWMMPVGFGKLHDNHLRITNPVNGNSITGEAGDNMGRGGRSSLYFKDEAAFIERPQLVEAAVSQNTDVCIDVSTPNGVGNPFHTKRMSGAVPVFTFHWRDDPRKDDAWYEKQRRTLDPIVVAQEIDIDYSASLEGIIIPRGWIEPALHQALYDNERGAIVIGGDVAEAGRDKSSAVVREGRNVLHLAEWHDPDGSLSAGRFIEIALQQEKRLEAWHKLYLMIDAIGVGAGTVGALRNYVKDNGKSQWVVVGVKVSSESPDAKCSKLKDALWWRMRDWFDAEEPAITAEAPDALRNKLVNELSTPTYTVNSRGLIQVESKDDMKRRGVPSPNLADALMHTFWSEQIKAAKPKPTWLTGKQRSGWTT